MNEVSIYLSISVHRWVPTPISLIGFVSWTLKEAITESVKNKTKLTTNNDKTKWKLASKLKMALKNTN